MAVLRESVRLHPGRRAVDGEIISSNTFPPLIGPWSEMVDTVEA